LPVVTPRPTLTPVPTLLPPASCQGGTLRLASWPVGSVCNAGGGWTTTIFAEGQGGNCIYTYLWNGEVKAGPMTGSTKFDIRVEAGPLLGKVAVTSAGQLAEAGIYLEPPACTP
jgi:hypothetical protein